MTVYMRQTIAIRSTNLELMHLEESCVEERKTLESWSYEVSEFPPFKYLAHGFGSKSRGFLC